MKRYGNYTRKESTRSSRLIIIAAEGECTEKIYFEALRSSVQNSRVHIKILDRSAEDRHNSSPEFVLNQLVQYENENQIADDDELWLVIDKDRWTIKAIKTVAQRCVQDSALHLALSNPCFELWLLLHRVDVEAETQEEKEKLLRNAKEGRSDTYLKRKMREQLGSYSESNYAAGALVCNVNDAITRAESLDVHKGDRWPKGLGTRVYKLAQSILKPFE